MGSIKVLLPSSGGPNSGPIKVGYSRLRIFYYLLLAYVLIYVLVWMSSVKLTSWGNHFRVGGTEINGVDAIHRIELVLHVKVYL